MTKGLLKSLVLTAAMATPLSMAPMAYANTGTSVVNPQAVNAFTQSVKTTLDAHDALARNDLSTARVKLDGALRSLETATRSDPTLGFAQKSGKAFHNDLKRLRSNLSVSNQYEVKTQLTSLLNEAGVVLQSN